MGNPNIVEVREAATADAGDVYIRHFELLQYLARRKFGVPEDDVENLVHEVFISYLSAASSIRDVRAWLIGAICNASRHYWRVRGRTESLPEGYEERGDPASNALAEGLALQITLRETLARLHPKCRSTLELHYYEGRSANEVARKLETTDRYAEKLIHKCLKRARDIYVTLTAR